MDATGRISKDSPSGIKMKSSIHSMIPVGWRRIRLKGLLSSRMAGAWGANQGEVEQDCICMRVADFDFSRGVFAAASPEDLTVRGYTRKQIEDLQLQKGDILVEKSGGGDKTPLGRAVMFDKDYSAVFSNFMERLRISVHRANVKFVYYSWIDKYWMRELYPFVKQTTGIQNLSMTKLVNEVKMQLPPCSEQERIVAFLDEKCAAVDKAIEVKRKQLESISGQRKSLITQSVVFGLGSCQSRKTNIEWMPLVNSGWEVVSLKRLLSRKMEYGLSEAAELEDESLPRYIRITDFGDDGELKGDTFRSLPVEIAKEAMLQANDVLFARSGATVGKSYIYTGWRTGACFAGYLIRAQTKTWRLNPKFLYYFTKSAAYDAWKGLIFTQATIQNISAVKYGQLKMPVPPVGTQNAIVSYLELKERKFDALAANLRKQIETLEQYRKSLIHEYVTGVRRVG